MKKLVASLFVAALICLATNQAQAKERGFLDPRLHLSVLTGLSYSPDGHDDYTNSFEAHNFHSAPLQLGVVLFNTEKVQFVKVSAGVLVGDAHVKDSDGDNASGHATIVFSPVVFKLFSWCWHDLQPMNDNDRQFGHRDGAFTFDVGVDLAGRAVFSLGVSL